MRPLLVLLVGSQGIEIKDLGPLTAEEPDLALSAAERAAGNIRGWGARLGQAKPEKVAAVLKAASIEAVMRAVESREGAFDVLLVATDQATSDGGRPETDTGELAEVLVRVLPLWAQRRGLGLASVERVVLESPPTPMGMAWPATAQVVDRAVGENARAGAPVAEPRRVHLAAMVGAPALRAALLTRFSLAHDVGRLKLVASWAIEGPWADPKAVPEPTLDIVGRHRLLELARRHRFAEMAQLISLLDDEADPTFNVVLGLSQLGAALMVLDLPAAHDHADRLGRGRDLSSVAFPATPGQSTVEVGPLADPAPLLLLLAGVLRARWGLGDRTGVLAVLHLISEYLPHLAWSSAGGSLHPLHLAAQAAGTPFGVKDPSQQGCPHGGGAEKGARAVRALEDSSDPEAWAIYLRSRFSFTGVSLGQCARRGTVYLTEKGPADGRKCTNSACTFFQQQVAPLGAGLAAGMAIALMFGESPVIELRHQSPVGHSFLAPGKIEIVATWNVSMARIAKALRRPGAQAWLDTAHVEQRLALVEPVATDDDLPTRVVGLLSAVAGRTLGEDEGSMLNLVDDIASELAEMLARP